MVTKEKQDKRVKDVVRIYLDEISRVPLLTHEEEVELAKRIERGDVDARKHLIEANLRLVVSVAKRFVRKSLNLTLLGLIQEGNMGLISAAKGFDWRRGTRFGTYAVFWIEGEIQSALARDRRDSFAKSSLDESIGKSEDSNLYGLVEDNKAECPSSEANTVSLRTVLDRILSELEIREQQIIRLAFGLLDGIAYNNKEIAKKLGIKREKVRQIKERAIRKLRSCKQKLSRV